MTINKALRLWATVAMVTAGGAACSQSSASARPPQGPREIRIVARNMTFYLQGDKTPNPTLRVRAGEEVRLILTNEEPGIDHDFAIRPWKVGTKLLKGNGEDAITFRVPGTAGAEIAYICTPHFGMMRGTILIE